MKTELKSIEQYELQLGKFQSYEEDRNDDEYMCKSWVFENGEVLAYYELTDLNTPVEVKVYENT